MAGWRMYRLHTAEREIVALGGTLFWEEAGHDWFRNPAGQAATRLVDRAGRVDLSWTKLDDDQLRQLVPHLQELAGLHTLDLSGTAITDAGLSSVSKLGGLRSLELTGTRITDAGLESLASLKGLRHLGLADTDVTDAGMAIIEQFRNLESLNLDHTAVTDQGLTVLTRLPRLHELSLSNTDVTAQGVGSIQKATPGVAISDD